MAPFASPEWIDELAAGRSDRLSGTRVLDVGTGTGALAMAAVALGAAHAVGFDLDPLAIREARLWTDRNGLADRVRLFTGGIDSLRAEDAAFVRFLGAGPALPVTLDAIELATITLIDGDRFRGTVSTAITCRSAL